MEPLALQALPADALVQLALRFRPLFERHAAGTLAFAVTTITIAEVLTGPLRNGDEALTKRYRAVLESWHVVELTADIARARRGCGEGSGCGCRRPFKRRARLP